MGNQNSSFSEGGSKESKSHHHRERQLLEKSASCGLIRNDGDKSNSSDKLSLSSRGSEPKLEIRCIDTSIAEKSQTEIQSQSQLSLEGDLKPSISKESLKVNNRHHYNIHSPSVLLNFKAGDKNSSNKFKHPQCTSSQGQQNATTNSNSSLFARRSSSTLEFISSSKSPLSNLIKGKFCKGSCDRLDVSGKGSEVSVLSPTGALGRIVKSGSDVLLASQKMNCNLDKFAKLLAQLSGFQKQGLISQPTFEKHLIPHGPVAAKYLWNFFANHKTADTISESRFVQSAEKIYALITDKDQITFYLKIFGYGKDVVERDSFMDFLISAYQLSTIGTSDSGMEMRNSEDFDGKEWLESVIKSCFHIKEDMSICFLSNWLLTNLPRLHLSMHKYILHQLTTGYTQLTTGNKTINMPSSGVTSISRFDAPNECNKTEPSAHQESSKFNPVLLWLLRCSLPGKFVSIFDRKPDQASSQSRALNPTQLIHQLMSRKTDPENWSRLYDSGDDGLSINRFQFHVFNYKGPTLMIVTADNGYSMAIASDGEWKESCHFWGGEDTVLLQLTPEFRIVERGPKILYVNFSIRGYPFGIQAGKDPKNVSMDIKPDFAYAHFKKIPCPISKFVVWGCAPQQAKVCQSEYKKWEAKQCEQIKKVNINSAEWKENPDKYLLELAGAYRSYNNGS